MPEFPLIESDINALAMTMQAGYSSAPADFPHADLAGLTALYDAYCAAAAEYTHCKAAAKGAAQKKRAQREKLAAFMRLQLKQSEADTAQDPVKLERIGWGPRAKGKTARAPGEPQHLTCALKDHGVVELCWRNPVRSDGGRVNTYLVERRETDAGGGFTPWHLVAVTFEKQILLTEEPRGQRMEYRVLGANRGGQGNPSNVAAAVV